MKANVNDEAVNLWFDELLAANEGLKAAVERLEHPGAGNPCDRQGLMKFLFRVGRSRTENWESMARSDVQDRIDTLEEALFGLDTLVKSELRRIVLPSSESDELETVREGLAKIVAKLKAVKPKVEKRRTPRTDSAVANLVRYVQHQTTAPCDKEVGKLVSAVLGKKMNMKRWRQLHQNLLKPKPAAKK